MTDLLVATMKGLYLVADGRSRLLREGIVYGISWDRRQLYLGDRDHPGGRVICCQGDLCDCEQVPFPELIHDVHQVLCWDGRLYAVNTGLNRIDVWDGQESMVWQWHETIQNEGQAPDHLNSVWCDGQYFWICEHRYGREPARIRVFDMDRKQVDLHEFYGLNTSHSCGLHNVYVEDGILFTLSVNCLVVRDLKTGGTRFVDPRPDGGSGYLRGLALVDRGGFYVGESMVAERERRDQGDAEILVLDAGLNLVDTILLKGTGQVHELRTLNGDRSHNGLPCPPWLRDVEGDMDEH